MIIVLKWANVGLRGLMEAGLIGALAYWGYELGQTPALKWLMGIGAPAIVFAIWGMFDFRNIVSHPEWFRLAQELILTGFAAYALYITGARELSVALTLLSIVHHAFVYITGDTLLRNE